jgi:glycosyltransferase involved in cell wall biosynthesis
VSSRASVVVPVYNGLPHLRALVDALLAQDHPDLEFVFSDGGSTDGSWEFLQTVSDPRVRLMTIPPGSGAAANWTAVTQAATGEFVKLVCQDDLIVPTAVSAQVADLQEHPHAVMAIAPRDIIDAKGNVVYAKRGCQGLAPGAHRGADVIHRCYVRGANVIGEPLAVMFRREPLLASMPWEDANPLMLDVTQYAKVAPLGDVVVRDQSIGAFRVSDSSWSTRLADVQREQFARWQATYAASLPTPPGRRERTRAWLGMEQQALLRRVAYRVLRMKGAFRSEDDHRDS